MRQTERLKSIYARSSVCLDGKAVTLPAKYMGNPSHSPFKSAEAKINTKGRKLCIDPETGTVKLIVREAFSGLSIEIKKVLPEISYLYKIGFHYLHVESRDEIETYGAYVEGEKLPFAWVSYSPVWREYKKEMLDYFGVESDCMAEMTRAWNSTWSPKNTLSTLFSFAHKQLKKQWKKQLSIDKKDSSLKGIITSINSNLGFHASAFKGIGFEIGGLKPAKFTYYKDTYGHLTYIPRRKLAQKLELKVEKQLTTSPNFETNHFPLLPTYEMVLLFDEEDHAELVKKSVYTISDSDYQNV